MMKKKQKKVLEIQGSESSQKQVDGNQPDTSKQKADELLAELEAEERKTERERQKRKEKKLRAKQKKKEAEHVESIFTTVPPEKPHRPAPQLEESKDPQEDLELISSYEPQDCDVTWHLPQLQVSSGEVRAIEARLESGEKIPYDQLMSMTRFLLARVKQLELANNYD